MSSGADGRDDGRGSAEILVDQLQSALGNELGKGSVIELAEFVAVLNSVQSYAGQDDTNVPGARRWRNALLVALTVREDDEVMATYEELRIVGKRLRPRGLEKLPTQKSMKRWSERSPRILRDIADARERLAMSSNRHLAGIAF